MKRNRNKEILNLHENTHKMDGCKKKVNLIKARISIPPPNEEEKISYGLKTRYIF